MFEGIQRYWEEEMGRVPVGPPKKVVKDKRIVEWQCGYCKGVNIRPDTKCTHCAAPRPFIYQ